MTNDDKFHMRINDQANFAKSVLESTLDCKPAVSDVMTYLAKSVLALTTILEHLSYIAETAHRGHMAESRAAFETWEKSKEVMK